MPASRTVTPSETRPSRSSAAIAGAVSRMSRPSPTRSSCGSLPRRRPRTRAKARPTARAVVSSISVPWSPRMSYALKMPVGARTACSVKAAPQRLVALLEGLRHHPRVGDHRHEVGVAAPAGHDVQVDVVLDAGAGDPALVEADVEAVRFVDLLEPRHRQ